MSPARTIISDSPDQRRYTDRAMNEPSALVFVVDDDVDMCRSMQRLLRAGGYETRTYASSAEFLMSHDPGIPGCVILDHAMPQLNGLEVQACLVAGEYRRPIVFLSGNASISTSVSAMRAGAVTFLTKPVECRDLFAAVDEALRIDAAQRAQQALQQAILERFARLTPRERQVFAQVVAGRLNKQIAADLGTVVKTIKVHRARVMQKMGVRTLAQLVRVAASLSLVATPAEAVAKAQRDDPGRSLEGRNTCSGGEKSGLPFSRPAGGPLL